MKPKNFYLYFLTISILTLTSCGGMKKSEIEKLNIVKTLDATKYAGKLYEIARFPHSFEKNMVGVTATYSLLPDGRIEVLNAGYMNSLKGKFKSTKAKAKIPNPAEPGKLKVYFFPLFGADYFVLELADNYEYALVGSSSYNYLWILNRQPQMPDSTYTMLVEKARARGYDISKLIKVEQVTSK